MHSCAKVENLNGCKRQKSFYYSFFLLVFLGEVIYTGRRSYTVETGGTQRIPFEAYSNTSNASLTYGISFNPPFITVEGNEVVIAYNGVMISPVVRVIIYTAHSYE